MKIKNNFILRLCNSILKLDETHIILNILLDSFISNPMIMISDEELNNALIPIN